MKRPATVERGVTLVEVTIVMVMASLVMVGLVGFYLNSQNTWLLASSQAITQREGTMALERMTQSIRESGRAIVTPSAGQVLLQLMDKDNNELSRYWWSASDSLLRWRDAGVDRGPLISSRIAMFAVSEDDSLVSITRLDLVDPNGDIIQLSSAAALYNHP